MTHNQATILLIYRPLLNLLSKNPTSVHNSSLGFVVTYLIFEEGIPDIFRDSGRSQDVDLTFLVVLGIDAVAECVPVFPNQLESTGRWLVW